MWYRRRAAARFWGAGLGLASLCIGGLAGCDVFNPALFGTLFPTSIPALDNPKGTIIIVVMNASNVSAAARLEVTKHSGGVVALSLPVFAADGDPANEGDHAMAVQDCDVASIQLVEVVAALPAGGAQRVPFSLPPLVDGVQLSCGKVVAVTISGSSPNLLVNMAVY